MPPNKALQLPANSAFQLRFGSILAATLGARATFGGGVGRSRAPIRWVAQSMTRTISLRKLFEICFVVLFSLPLVAHAELTRPAIFLYQTSDVLTNRTTANELAEFIRLVQSKLILENFSRADGDYAVVIAVHPSRQILGWACVKSGQRLEEAQNEVNRLTRSIDAPSVTNGSIVFALVYSATTDSAQSPWLPIPAEWTGIIESSGKPMEIDPILEELFENIAS